MEPPGTAAPAPLPLACTLSPDDGSARMRRWQQLTATAGATARRAGHRLEVSYRAGPGVRPELEALAAAEAQCCSFVTWAVRAQRDRVFLQVTAAPGSPDDLTPIAVLFGAT